MNGKLKRKIIDSLIFELFYINETIEFFKKFSKAVRSSPLQKFSKANTFDMCYKKCTRKLVFVVNSDYSETKSFEQTEI